MEKRLVLNRDVTIGECGWLDRDFKRGEVVWAYIGVTYGVISEGGRAVTESEDEEPFFELPEDALDSYVRKFG